MAGTHCHGGLSLVLHTGSSKEEKILKGLTYLGAHMEKRMRLRDRNIKKKAERDRKKKTLMSCIQNCKIVHPVHSANRNCT